MDEKARQRMDAATVKFMYKINEGSPRNFGTAAKLEEYRFNHDASRPDIAFSIVRKVRPGEGTDGSNWQRLGSITQQQAALIEQTSRSEEEIMDRLHKLLIQGIDTTRLAVPQTGISQEQLEIEVQKRLDAILARNETIQKILRAGTAAGVAKEPVPEMPSGIQKGKNNQKGTNTRGPAWQAKMAEIHKQVATYKERLVQMGRPDEEVPINKVGPYRFRPPKAWMAQIDQEWATYLETHATPAEPTAPV